MAERLMCDEGAKVTVGGSGERLSLTVSGEGAVRFWTATDDIDEAIETRTPLQLSVRGGFCNLQVRGDRVRLDFAVGDSRRRSCDFPLKDLTDALAMVRGQ